MTLKLRPGVLYRVFVNFMFWALVMVGLFFASGRVKNVPLLANQDAKVLGVDKIIEIADGEVWLFQAFAGLGALGILLLERRWAKDQYIFFKKLTQDDFYPIFLNFGTLFILSGGYRLVHGKPNSGLNLCLGTLNLLFYCFGSEFDGKKFEKDEASSGPVPVNQLSADPYLATLVSPRDFRSQHPRMEKPWLHKGREQSQKTTKDNETS